MNFKLREFRDGDMPDILSLWEKTGLGNRQRGDDAGVIRLSLSMGGKLIVMTDRDDKRIIGTSWITFDGRRLHLHHLGVDPEYQGQGMSKPLLNESLRFARRKGVQIKLEVHQDNRKAIQLYKEYQFNYLGDYRVYIIRDLSVLDDFERQG